MNKRIGTCILCIVIVLTSTLSFAEAEQSMDQIELSLEKAVRLSYDNDISIVNAEKGLEAVAEGHRAAVNGKHRAKDMYDKLLTYIDLHDKKLSGEKLTSDESTIFTVSGYIFGKKRPYLPKTDEYKNYISPIEIQHFDLYNQMENTRTDIEQLKETNRRITTEFYYGLVGLEIMVVDGEEYLSLLSRKHEELKQSFQVGLVSEISLETNQAGLDKAKINQDKLVRQRDNMAMQLKARCALPLDQEIVTNQDGIYRASLAIDTLSAYYELAIENRAEVVKAKRLYETKVREEGFLKQYYQHENLTERIEIAISVSELEHAYNQSIEDVKKDIMTGYQEITNAKNKLMASKLDKDLAQEQYKNTQSMFNKGLVKETDLISSQLNYSNKVSTMYTNLRDYSKLRRNFDKAIDVGPGYVLSGGF